MLAPTYGSEWTCTVSTRSSVLDYYYCAHVFKILWCILYFLYFSFTSPLLLLYPWANDLCILRAYVCVCIYVLEVGLVYTVQQGRTGPLVVVYSSSRSSRTWCKYK